MTSAEAIQELLASPELPKAVESLSTVLQSEDDLAFQTFKEMVR
jgi:hypothetical protein